MKSTIREQIREALIQELGDTTDAYGYMQTFLDMYSSFFQVSYGFMTEKGTRYEVHMRYRVPDDFIGVDFTAENSFTKVVNEGTTFRTIATVMRIVSDFWMDRREIITSHQDDFFEAFEVGTFDQIQGFSFRVDSPDGLRPKDTSRFKLYNAFIRQQFPSAQIQTKGLDILVTP